MIDFERPTLGEFVRVVRAVGVAVLAIGVLGASLGMLVYFVAPSDEGMITLSAVGEMLAMYAGMWTGTGALIVGLAEGVSYAGTRVSLTDSGLTWKKPVTDGGEER